MDPFWEAEDHDVLIGHVHVYMQSLSYMVNEITYKLMCYLYCSSQSTLMLLYTLNGLSSFTLSHQIEMEDTLDITDYKGQKQGSLSVELLPCSSDGSLPGSEDDLFVDKPEELVSVIS